MSKLATNAKDLATSSDSHPRVDPYVSPMAVRIVGVRHHVVVPNNDATVEVLDSRHRLLHEMGGS